MSARHAHALAALLALLLSLCGCSRVIPSDYTLITPHSTQSRPVQESDVLTASDYKSLKNDLRALVQNGVEHGVIHTNQYAGDVEEDLPKAVYEIAREDPIGAYAIDYITHDCTLIVAYYEIRIDITFRDVLTPLDEIEYTGGEAEAMRLIQQAVADYDDHLTLYATYLSQPDYDALVQTYCDEHWRQIAAAPSVRVTSYPQDARNRIVELEFAYPASRTQLRQMERDVSESLLAAEVYVRFCQSQTEKASLLYTYLAERFAYRQGESRTPVYSALCEGVADSRSMARSWQLLCEETGLECQIVSGMRGGESWWWNVVTLDGARYHVDILSDLLASDHLRLRYDEDMAGEYYWDAAQVPACPAPETPEEQPPAESETPEEPGETPETPETPDVPAETEPEAPAEPEPEPPASP